MEEATESFNLTVKKPHIFNELLLSPSFMSMYINDVGLTWVKKSNNMKTLSRMEKNGAIMYHSYY